MKKEKKLNKFWLYFLSVHVDKIIFKLKRWITDLSLTNRRWQSKSLFVVENCSIGQSKLVENTTHIIHRFLALTPQLHISIKERNSLQKKRQQKWDLKAGNLETREVTAIRFKDFKLYSIVEEKWNKKLDF